jgi:hypothetical protein
MSQHKSQTSNTLQKFNRNVNVSEKIATSSSASATALAIKGTNPNNKANVNANIIVSNLLTDLISNGISNSIITKTREGKYRMQDRIYTLEQLNLALYKQNEVNIHNQTIKYLEVVQNNAKQSKILRRIANTQIAQQNKQAELANATKLNQESINRLKQINADLTSALYMQARVESNIRSEIASQQHHGTNTNMSLVNMNIALQGQTQALSAQKVAVIGQQQNQLKNMIDSDQNTNNALLSLKESERAAKADAERIRLAKEQSDIMKIGFNNLGKGINTVGTSINTLNNNLNAGLNQLAEIGNANVNASNQILEGLAKTYQQLEANQATNTKLMQGQIDAAKAASDRNAKDLDTLNSTLTDGFNGLNNQMTGITNGLEATANKLEDALKNMKPPEIIKTLNEMKPCPRGFCWQKDPTGGYTCCGGSHHIADEDLDAVINNRQDPQESHAGWGSNIDCSGINAQKPCDKLKL